MFKSKEDRFVEAVEKADISWTSISSDKEDGYCIIDLYIDSRFWHDSVEAVKDLCDEWGAEYETNFSLDEITLRLKL